MAYGELYLTPELPDSNFRKYQFKKGHIPHNKGKKWDEYLSKSAQENIKKGWENFKKRRPTKRPDVSERCRKKVVAVMDDGAWFVIPYIGKAAEMVKASRSNIRVCCQLNKAHHTHLYHGTINTDHRCRGVRFYFEDDPTWMDKIKK